MGIGEQFEFEKTGRIDEEPKLSDSASLSCYTLGDYDRWFLPCENCGYDTGKASESCEARCHTCGDTIKRDFTKRALKLFIEVII